MQKIYFLFSKTPSKMGEFVRYWTKNPFNHVSLSLTEDLSTLYSFSRYHRNSAFYGGFVEESLLRYADAEGKVAFLELSDEAYDKIKQELEQICAQKQEYLYNTLSALFVPLHIRIPISKSFTCIEFAEDLLLHANVISKKKFYAIRDLETLTQKNIVYQGALASLPQQNSWKEDTYPLPIPHGKAFFSILKNYFTLLQRLVYHP